MRLFILLILLCSLCLPVRGEEGFALSFTQDGAGGMLIAGYTGVPEAALLLPEAAEGLPVTGIAEEALSGLAVDSLSLPRSIRTIGRDSSTVQPENGLPDNCETLSGSVT